MQEDINNNNNLPKDFVNEEIALRHYYLRKTTPGLDVEDELKQFHKRQQYSQRNAGIVWIGIAAAILMVAFVVFYRINNNVDASKNRIVYRERSSEKNIILSSGNTGRQVLTEGVELKNIVEGGTPGFFHGILSYESLGDMIAVQEQVVLVPNQKMLKLVLEDGTQIWINAQSKLKFPNRFEGNERRVALEGEAYFKVAKDKTRPFIVEINGLITKVLGTEFNVKSLKNTPSQVTLLEGKVEVHAVESGKAENLLPGDEIVLAPSGALNKYKIDIENYYSWRDGFFFFDQLNLDEALREIARWYNMNVIIENAKAAKSKIRFTAERSEDKRIVVELLNELKVADIRIEGNNLIVQ